MTCRRRSKKRPCKICRKWFRPDPRVGDRQKTCGTPECKRKWHTRKCAEWNRKHRVVPREDYWSDRLLTPVGVPETEGVGNASSTWQSAPQCRDPAANPFSRLPRARIQAVIGIQTFVIIEYVAQQLFRAIQEVKRGHRFEIKGKSRQVPRESRSRSDGMARSP